MKHSHKLMFVLLLTLFPLSPAALAQSSDRAQLEKEIDALRAQMKEKEERFLAPSREDQAAFAEFLRQPNTGLIRLLPREKYDGKLSIRGGGAYYSFNRLTHEYGYGSDITLEQGSFSVGFAGADFGFMLRLGDVPLENVTSDYPGVQLLSAFVAPSTEPEAREQQRRANAGFQVGNLSFQRRLPALATVTYVVRSINYHYADSLIAFRVVRKDADGSVVILWKMLKQFPEPQLAR